jgi:hypothetical protein
MSTALVQQMISDATAAIRADPKAATAWLRVDPVRPGEPDNYIGVWVPEVDLLRLYIPRAGQPCKFALVICPSWGPHDTQYYAVTPFGDVGMVRLGHRVSELDPVSDSVIAKLADLARLAAGAVAGTGGTR